MRVPACAWGVLIGLSAAPAAAQDWTPHAAAALLDASFPALAACQQALDDARGRESRAAPVHGLSYTHLFEHGRCQSFTRKGAAAWRIRMHWAPRGAGATRDWPAPARQPAP